MNCWHCNHELIWGGDHDIDEEDETFSIETNLSCPECGTFVLVFEKEEDA
jgi:DNA-directed RNA polymerase subunit RPC12/RpoP